jgi:iron complex transport system substrate-binding protein
VNLSPRIVSLLPSATEIVCALGFKDHLVGRSHECDFPAGLDNLPVCSAPRIDVGGGSREIDDEIRDIVRRGLSVYEVREDVLKSLAPDFIVTQTQCEICAVSKKDVENAVHQWTGGQPQIVSLEPRVLDDVWSDIRHVAELLNVRSVADRIVDVLRSRMRSIRERTAGIEARPRVATVEWTEPLMSAGNWTPEIIDMAGGENLFGETGKHSPSLKWRELRDADPDTILVMPCGFSLDRALEATEALSKRDGWASLKAAGNHRVYAADGHHFFNRPGPRLVESLEIVAEILNPGVMHFGHESSGWTRFFSD